MADQTPHQLIEDIISAKSPEQVDDAFKAASKLDESDRKIVINTVEMFFVENFKAFVPAIKHEVEEVRALFKELEDAGMMGEVNEGLNSSPLAKQIIEPFQTQAQMAWRIFEAKGEDTDPFVKSMIKRSSALSTDEFNSVQGVISVKLGLIDEVSPPDNKGPGFNPPPPFNPGRPKFGF